MKLHVKIAKWSAGFPVVMLNEKTAKELGFHLSERLMIKTLSNKKKQFSAVLDTVGSGIKKDEILVSSEVIKKLRLKENQLVDVSLSETPRSIEFIKTKINGKPFSKEEILEVIKDVVDNSLSQPEVALFISAMYQKGMNFKETTDLIEALLFYGKKLKLGNKIIADKHCIGGIPGNRTTPLVVSICSSLGLTMPKTSSRAITSAAGTADVIEAIAKVDFDMDHLKKIIKKTNACLVWGGGLNMVPADSKIIKIEKILNIDPEAQLLASIMSKKLAVGSKYILIDIPYGKGAKVNLSKALHLKRKFIKIGKHFGVEVKVELTKGNQPIGKGIGPVLELIDILKILNPKEEGPKDLEEKSLNLSAKLLEMTGKAKRGKGYSLAREALYSGKAQKKFLEIIKAQKGSIKDLSLGKFKKDILSPKKGKLKNLDNKKINSLARIAGCPKDKKAGIYLYKNLKERVNKGEPILTIYAESRSRLEQAFKYFEKNEIFEIK